VQLSFQGNKSVFQLTSGRDIKVESAVESCESELKESKLRYHAQPQKSRPPLRQAPPLPTLPQLQLCPRHRPPNPQHPPLSQTARKMVLQLVVPVQFEGYYEEAG